MKSRFTLAGMVSLAVVFASASMARAADLTNVKCPVSGKAAAEGHAVDFDGGKVYFCCDKCPVAFNKSKGKFAAKAAHQLALTGQAKQEKCPLTGKKIAEGQSVDVDGVKVNFCCDKCQAKAAKLKGDALINLCFGPGAFKKGFKVEAQ